MYSEPDKYKFRAWYREHDKWVYGWITKIIEGDRRSWSIVCFVDGELTQFYIHNERSVGQWTGKVDRNGVPVYVGDFIEGFDYPVTFEDGAFVVTIKYDLVRIPLFDMDSSDLLVVGNIIENPEMYPK